MSVFYVMRISGFTERVNSQDITLLPIPLDLPPIPAYLHLGDLSPGQRTVCPTWSSLRCPTAHIRQTRRNQHSSTGISSAPCATDHTRRLESPERQMLVHLYHHRPANPASTISALKDPQSCRQLALRLPAEIIP
jgi:hypothetical protein